MPAKDLVIDGSSTAYPIVSAVADDFSKRNPGLTVIVNKSGTGSGMQKFLRGEIDIAAASRPVDAREAQALRAANLPFLEIPFAYDGVSVIVSRKNTWVDRMSLKELQNAWKQTSAVAKWSDIRSGWPSQPIDFYGPTDNHGTYEYFSEAMAPGSASLRRDVQTNQEYNAIVQAIADDRNGIGYVGLSYFAYNQDKVRAVPIDFGNGYVSPTPETIRDDRYRVLSRPLFLYVSKAAYDSRPDIRHFVEFVLSASGEDDVAETHYVKLPMEALSAVRRHVAAEKVGSVMEPGRALTVSRLAQLE